MWSTLPIEIGGKNPQVPWLQGAGRHCDRFWEEGCPNCPSIGPDQNTPFTVSSMVGGPKCPSSSPPLCQAETEWEVNRGLLDDDLEPIDCQSRQIAIVPLDSRLELLLNSFATITCCHVGLRVPVYNFTIQDHKISPPWTSTTSGSCLWWWSTWVWFYEQTEVLLKVGQTSCRTYNTPVFAVWSNEMKYNTRLWWEDEMNTGRWYKDGIKRRHCQWWLVLQIGLSVQMSSYKSASVCPPPSELDGQPPYVAIGTIDAPRYPRYPLVKERPDVGDIHWRHRFFNMCPYQV